MCLKSNTRRGVYTRNFNLSGFQGRFRRAVAVATMSYGGQSGSFTPVFDGIHLDHFVVDRANAVLDVDGLPTSRIRELTVSDSQFTGVIAVDRVRHADVAWRGVTVNGRAAR